MTTMWGGRFAEGPSALLRALNDSFAFDCELLAEDVEGSIAWAKELERAGVLAADEAGAIVAALSELSVASCQLPETTLPDARRPLPGETLDVPSPSAASATGNRQPATAFRQPATVAEDVHSYVDDHLRDKVGALAGKLHTGRSRNDQVATDLKLWLRKAFAECEMLVTHLARTLAHRATEEAATPMPGYTHSKQAEPITFGHWCLAYVEMLRRDLSRLEDAIARNDECPLGSGALAGSPVAIDRQRLAKSLGFARATANSIDGVADRDFAVEYLFGASLLLSHLSRMAEDLIFFSSDEAAYVELPDALASGSSRMPQKKNPDILELVRGHAARSIGELTGLLALLKGLPLAYDKDLQLDKEPLFRTRTVLGLVLPALTALVAGLKLDRDRMRAAAGSELLLATHRADQLAAKGIPFREAHEIVGRTLHEKADVTVDDVLATKNVYGGTAPSRVKEAAAFALSRFAGGGGGE